MTLYPRTLTQGVGYFVIEETVSQSESSKENSDLMDCSYDDRQSVGMKVTDDCLQQSLSRILEYKPPPSLKKNSSFEVLNCSSRKLSVCDDISSITSSRNRRKRRNRYKMHTEMKALQKRVLKSDNSPFAYLVPGLIISHLLNLAVGYNVK